MENQKQLEEHIKLQQQIQQLDQIAKQYLTKEALVRYGNIKAAHTELSIKLSTIILQLIQSGHTEKITDQELKEILRRLQSPKKEFKFKRA